MITLSRSFNKYKQNLSIVDTAQGTYIKSYSTLVAKVDYKLKELHQLGYWSKTTQKHINYAANQLNLNLIKN